MNPVFLTCNHKTKKQILENPTNPVFLTGNQATTRQSVVKNVPGLTRRLSQEGKVKQIVYLTLKNSTKSALKEDSIVNLIKDLVEKKTNIPCNSNLSKAMDWDLLDANNSFEFEDLFTENELINNNLIDESVQFESESFNTLPHSDNDYALFPQLMQESGVESELAGLSELPLEDFIDIDRVINNLDSTDFQCNKNDIIEELFGDFSEQNSPADVNQHTQNELKELLNTIDESKLFDNVLNFNDNSNITVVNSSMIPITESASAELLDHQTTTEKVDILAILNEQFCLDQDIQSSNEKRALKRKCVEMNSISEHAIDLKVAKIHTDNDDFVVPICTSEMSDFSVPPSPTLSTSSSSSSLSGLVDEEKKFLRRVKNNEASKVTRSRRKAKHQDLFAKEIELRNSNAKLQIKIEAMQKEAELLRDVLIAKLSNVTNI